MLEDLDSVPWGTLTHAYGRADDVPGLLRGLLAADPQAREEARNHLWGTIFHQGTRYEASRYAVPFLFELVAEPFTPERHEVLDLLTHLAVGYPEVWMRTGFQPDEVRARQAAWEANKYELDEIHVYDAVRAHAEMLRALADDADEAVRQAAVFALAFIPDEREASLPVIRRRIDADADDPGALTNALLAYGLLGGPADDGIRAHLDSPEVVVRFAAACAVARQGEGLDALLTCLEHEDALVDGRLMRWNVGDLVGVGWVTVDAAAPDFDLGLVRRLCATLARAGGLSAETLAGVLLVRLFPAGPASVPERADGLTPGQRLLLETLAANRTGWTVAGMQFANFFLLITRFGLPGDAESVASYLGGAPLTDCLPPGLRGAG